MVHPGVVLDVEGDVAMIGVGEPLDGHSCPRILVMHSQVAGIKMGSLMCTLRVTE